MDNAKQLALELGCNLGTLPTTYLSLPLGSRQASTNICDGAEEKFSRKLVIWKSQYISKRGRLILIRNMMTNLSVYLMSLFRMPMNVSSRLEKIQRDFVWGSSSIKRKIHLIKWENVCRCKMKGGLGIRSLILMDKALLSKWA